MSGDKIVNPADSVSATTLHTGAEQTVVTSRSGIASAPPMTLPLGSVTSARLFKHNPPTEAEIEDAIMLVEDELFRIRHAIVEGAS